MLEPDHWAMPLVLLLTLMIIAVVPYDLIQIPFMNGDNETNSKESFKSSL